MIYYPTPTLNAFVHDRVPPLSYFYVLHVAISKEISDLKPEISLEIANMEFFKISVSVLISLKYINY